MTKLQAFLQAEIEAHGPLDIARYMELCLSHPKFGYYMTRDPLGSAGDFTTAPEISQLFGEMVGLWLAQVWMDQGAPAQVHLVEFGPGRGTLMRDILNTARRIRGFSEALEVWLIETSPVLRDAQSDSLQTNARWIDGIAEVPSGPILAIGNEFLDALPIQQYQKIDEIWFKRTVKVADDGRFVFGPSKLQPGEAPPETPPLPDGTIVEACPTAENIVGQLSKRLADQGGAALFIDYGEMSGTGDTLQAVRAHQSQHPLEHPGDADLTAHVNFGAVSAAVHPDCVTHFTEQGAFLATLGIGQRAAALAKDKPETITRDLAASLNRLTAEDQMGKLFKVMSITPKKAPSPPGFPNDT